MPKYFLFYFLLSFLFSNYFIANIWVEGNEEFNIKRLEYFSALKNISISSGTYPIPIKRLNSLENYKGLSIGELIEHNSFITNEFNAESNSSLKINYFSKTLPIRSIHDDWISKSSLVYKTSLTQKNFSATLNLSIANDEFDNKRYFLDGTSISFLKWNNILGFGYINRWWGPTHNNNLILSNYARPSPGFFLNSFEPLIFDNFLSFFGAIDYVFFINRLESNRHIKNPLLIGTRLSFNPIKNLNFGFSRTLTMGGEGRREDFSTFLKAFFGALEGADNPGLSAANKDGYDYSNQLAGYDLKYDFFYKHFLASIYFQEVAEDGDTSSTSPLSGYTSTFGSEIKYDENGLLRALTIEFSRTKLDRHNSSKGINTAYEHWIYKSGYRYRGLPIAAFIDNDSKYTQISYSRELSEKQLFELNFYYSEPNMDATGRHIWGNSGDPFYGIKTKYEFDITKNLSAKIILNLSDKKLNFLEKSLDKNILGFSAEYNF
tara:strand:+ start:347 stop:1816 length:1470 start_codon:yes stop_codon:yes gene_type:complete